MTRHLCSVAVLVSAFASAATYYAGPGGNSVPDAGTAADPWDLGFALQQVKSGDVVVLQQGPYAAFTFNCATRPVLDVTLRAERERRATVPSFILSNCNWTIEGLRVLGAGTRVLNDRGTLRRNLWVSDGGSMLEVDAVGTVLEENELRGPPGVLAVVTTGAGPLTMRRNHLVDRGLLVYTQHGVLLENNVFENPRSGDYAVLLPYEGVAPVLIGNLFRGQFGLVAGSSYPNAAVGPMIRDSVMLDGVLGLYFRHVDGAVVDSTTVVGAMSVATDQNGDAGPGSVRISRGQFFGPVSLLQQTSASVTTTNFWGLDGGPIAAPISSTGSVTTSLVSQVDPRLRGCYAVPPADSPLRGMLGDGGRVGAEVLYRSIDGGLTQELLWELARDGGFPCGAVITGVNDDPATACTTLHLRFGVDLPDCPLPRPAPPPDGGTDGGADGGTDGGADAGSSDAGTGGGLHFTSVPPELARCGEPYAYRPQLDVNDAVLGLSTTSGDATLDAGTLVWPAPAAGETGRFVLVATRGTARAEQQVTVFVDCPSPQGCGCDSSGALAPLVLLLAAARRRRTP